MRHLVVPMECMHTNFMQNGVEKFLRPLYSGYSARSRGPLLSNRRVHSSIRVRVPACPGPGKALGPHDAQRHETKSAEQLVAGGANFGVQTMVGRWSCTLERTDGTPRWRSIALAPPRPRHRLQSATKESLPCHHIPTDLVEMFVANELVYNS